jgi:orotate phosphoribosyltransferase
MNSDRVATMLVECGAIEFRTEPLFRFTSGVSSPIYIDNRHLLGFVDARRAIIAGLAEAASAEAASGQARPPAWEAVAGTATAGIPWAAWLADFWSLPLLYVRANAKEWGRRKSVEGLVNEGWRTILVEDLIHSGGSARKSAESLRSAGLHVDTCVCIVTYDTPAGRRLVDDGLAVRALTTVDEALEAAVRLGRLSTSDRTIVAEWLSGIRSA